MRFTKSRRNDHAIISNAASIDQRITFYIPHHINPFAIRQCAALNSDGKDDKIMHQIVCTSIYSCRKVLEAVPLLKTELFRHRTKPHIYSSCQKHYCSVQRVRKRLVQLHIHGCTIKFITILYTRMRKKGGNQVLADSPSWARVRGS